VTIGQRRHLVTVQAPGAPVADGDGGYTQTWAPLAPADWWVRIQPATAKDLERVAAGTVISTATHIVTGRYHPQITTATRIVEGARIFEVTGVSDPEERHIETICTCVELLA
jgi:SPP1 family predicted phage head-tail adaptor